MKSDKYTINDFNNDYPDDNACLDKIFQNRYGHLKSCPKCDRETTFHRIKSRKVYSCKFCGFQISPVADTIFHKSSTSLRNWFYAIFLFSCSKNGVSGKELERQLGVTYKTAWRMAKQIRELFSNDIDLLSGTVEIDETYVGGKGENNKRGRGAENKTPVVGMVERNGNMKAVVTKDTTSSTVMPLIRESVRIMSEVMTDQYAVYNDLGNEYDHRVINHAKHKYVKGEVYTNTIEGFWSQLKRSVNGTYHSVSPKYLQNYVNEFAFRYNNRTAISSLFPLLIRKIT